MKGVIEFIRIQTNISKVTLHSLENRPGRAAALFTDLARLGFEVGAIAGTDAGADHCDITFTVEEQQSELLLEHVQNHLASYGAASVVVDPSVALLTIHGMRIPHTRGLVGGILARLAARDINVQTIAAGMSVIVCLIARDRADEAAATIREAFGQ